MTVPRSESVGALFALAALVMDTDISRRDFVARAVLLLAVPAAMRVPRSPLPGPAVRVGVVQFSPGPTDSRTMGLILGAEEASHAAALFGGSFELVPAQGDRMKAATLSAVIGDGSCENTHRIARQAASLRTPFFNVGCSADALRGGDCSAYAFHVSPSDAMCRDARSAAHADGEVLAWHSSLVRFGADTLNRRFLERFGTPMTAAAWTAWFSTKVLWESALRARSGEPGALVEYLGRDTTQFDGHKGLPLSFRSWDHQLRQPLYVVHGAKVGEAPVSTKPGEPARDLLDRLGTAASNSTCRSGT